MKARLAMMVFSFVLLVPVAASAQTQICIPQFVDGVSGPYRWQTTVVLQNHEPIMAQVRLQFFDGSGQPSTFMMHRRGAPGQFQFGRNSPFSPAPINARAMIGYRSGGTGPLQAGFCIIDSSARIQAHVMLHLYDQSGRLLSETGMMPAGQLTGAARPARPLQPLCG
jgi:hypothetical protein